MGASSMARTLDSLFDSKEAEALRDKTPFELLELILAAVFFLDVGLEGFTNEEVSAGFLSSQHCESW